MIATTNRTNSIYATKCVAEEVVLGCLVRHGWIAYNHLMGNAGTLRRVAMCMRIYDGSLEGPCAPSPRTNTLVFSLLYWQKMKSSKEILEMQFAKHIYLILLIVF